MTNTIKEFLQGQEESTVKDLAEYGVMNVGHKELMYNEDILNFFNRYEDDIEAVILDHVEGLSGDTFYDLTNTELLESLNEYTNLEFTTIDEMLELLSEKAFKQAEVDNAEEWDDMDEYEIEELVFDYMETLEVLPTDQDKINFVCLAVEIVAQNIIEERETYNRYTEAHSKH